MKITNELLHSFNTDIVSSQNIEFPGVFEICGNRFVILEGVFNPLFYDSTEFFAQALPYPKGNSFFEVGLGSGSIAVTALLKGCSFSAGIDLNANSIKNSLINARIHKVEDRVAFELQDIMMLNSFGECGLVFWAHPWVNSPLPGKYGVIERSIMDPNYLGLDKYLFLATQSIASRVFLGFGNTGDYDKLYELCRKHGLRVELHSDEVSKIDSKYTYQLLELLK